jgi:DNA-binding transcriptional LysR family regulator
MNLELHLLRAFVTVADTRHVTKAAAALHLTQPAVSGHVKALEARLQLKLFERTPSGMRLTRAGESLLPHARAVLAAEDHFKISSKRLLSRKAVAARLGTILDPEFLRIGKLLAAILEKHPWIEIELQHGITTWATDKLLKGELDAAFGLGAIEDPRIASHWLSDVKHVVVYPSAWKRRLHKAQWEDLARLPWIYPPKLSPQRRLLVEVFARHGLTPAQVVEADQESTMRSLVAAGLGLSMMREDLARAAQAAGKLAMWPPGRTATTLSFLHAAERGDDPVVATMRDTALAAWSRTAV